MADEVLTAGKKIALLGEWFGLTQEAWGEYVGVHRGTIASYKARENASPKGDKVRALAKRFAIPVTWFYDGVWSDPPIPQDAFVAENAAFVDVVEKVNPADLPRGYRDILSDQMVELPVWQGVAAGYADECYFLEESYPQLELIPKWMLSGGNPREFAIVRPVGGSMAERIVQRDLVLVKTEESPAPGSLVIARREDGHMFVKVFKPNGVKPELHSINERFHPIRDLDEWKFIADVKAIWKPWLIGSPNVEYQGGMTLRG